jgi:solute carrier family 39 (zinc transporter), member 9
MGVLVGTSLIVIIPEGVETLYSANNVGHGHKARSLVDRNLDVRWQTSAALDWKRHAQDTNPFDDLPGPALPNDVTPGIPVVKGDITPQSEPGKDGSQKGGQDTSKTDKHSKDDHHANESTHVWIGFSLISGFIMMYLIDQLPRHASSPKPPQQPYHISLDNLGRGLHRASSPSRNGEGDGFLESNQPRSQQPEGRSFATTTGLVIHAAADGIALGASSTTSDSSLSFIIFLAIMVHKAPAAFGLTSVLLKQGLSKRAARGHLLLFSLAAPTGAILTWALAHSLGRGLVGTEEGTRWWTGVLLLFSGGTFLYD